MTATYTFDIFSSLDGFGSHTTATGAATGASRAPSCSTTVSPSTTQEQRMVFGATTFREFVAMLGQSADGRRRRATLGHPDDEHAGDRGVLDAAGAPRLAERDRLER